MVMIDEVTAISITPNPVNSGAGLMITVTTAQVKLTWGAALKYRWNKLKAHFWGD